MNKVQEVLAKLDKVTVVPCWKYGDGSRCTRKLTGRFFQCEPNETCFECCSFHLKFILKAANPMFYEVKL